jgi:14-3-3 protein epsilon
MSYDKHVYLAMLAEQCGRHEDMVGFLEELIKTRDNDFNTDERNLISIAYKNSINSKRTALRTIIAYENKEKKKDNSTFLSHIQEYKKKTEEELTKACNQVLSSIDQYFLKRASEDEAKVFYLKMKGDYYRYIAEYAHGENKENASNNALDSYKQASEFAKNLSPINPIALGLALNLSVFYYEIMNDKSLACDIAKKTLDLADKELNVIDSGEDNNDILSIVNLMRENLEMWKFEGEEED